MRDNVIFLVVDSLLYTSLGFKREYSPTPFIDKIIKESTYADNMYAQAPFTEAAIISLITSGNTMDNGGYLKKLKDQRPNIGEIFKEYGYETFHQCQPHIYPSSLIKGFSSVYYSVVFDINALWNYRLEYFSKIYINNDLSDEDMDNLVDLMEENFNGWIKFLEDVKNQEQSVELIIDNIKEYDAELSLCLVVKEYDKFKMDRHKYMVELLTKGKESAIFSIPVPEQTKIRDDQWKSEFITRYKEFFKKSFEINKKLNKKNNRISFKELINIFRTKSLDCNENKLKQVARYFYNYRKSIDDPDFMDRISFNYDKFKPSPSMYSHLRHLEKWEENRTESEKPFFAYIHVDDVHTPEMFYSYDIKEKSILEEEFQVLENFLKDIPSDYKGSLSYDYSLAYADLCIKRMFQWLKDRGMYKNTTVVITADHGFSFTYNPIRKNAVNNFYDENYRIPFIMFKNGKAPNKITKLCSSIDIIPTIADYISMEEIKGIRGISLLEDYDREFITMEYMGGGCPDIHRRDIKYCIRNYDYKVSYSVNIKQDFQQGQLLEVYDLNKDPMNVKNLKKQYDNIDQVKKLLVKLKERHEELQGEYRDRCKIKELV